MTSEIRASGADIFECENCGTCCRGFGGTYVSAEHINEIAAFLETDPETVKNRYTVPAGSKRVLAQKPDGYCVFWDKHCTIHPVKPRMCRAWPFIESVLRAPENWHIMAGSCPGMKTNGISERFVTACVERELGRLKRRNAILPEAPPGKGGA